MGVKITDLPSASNSNNNDLLAIVQNGETKNVQKAVLVESVNNNIADNYSTASTYNVGDCCIYQGQLYVCTTAIPTAEEWNASHWQQVNLSEEIKNKLSNKVNQSQIVNIESSSQEDTYNCNYLNNAVLEKYSTTETKIGTWINNKPLYRKVINFGALPNATTKQVSLNISNLELVTNLRGIAQNSSGSTTVIVPIVSMTIDGMCGVYINEGNVVVTANNNRSSLNAYFIVDYTKTTD